MPLQKLKNEFPSYGIKGFTDVKLEEKSRDFAFVESSCKVADIHEVIMNASSLNESTLSIGNKVIHMRRKAEGNHFSDDLCNAMD